MRKYLASLAIVMSGSLFAQDRFADVKITSQHVAGSAHMLVGAGGNIGVSAGEDGILIIDDQFAPLAEKIAASISGIKKGNVSYVINTHFHGDHTGGNAWFTEVHNATVFAHDNVRKRLKSKEKHSHAELPVVTYQDTIHFHFNGDTIKVVPLSGHTDGDSAVFFEKANVLHAGDLFFEKRFPFVDLKGGGSVQGYMDSVQVMIDMIDDKTKVIPGHGDLTDKQGFIQFLSMMKVTAAKVLAMKTAGQSEQEVVDAGLGDEWKDWSWRFITEERWIKTLYQGQ